MVVLPDLDGPSRARNSPASRSKVAKRTQLVLLKAIGVKRQGSVDDLVERGTLLPHARKGQPGRLAVHGDGLGAESGVDGRRDRRGRRPLPQPLGEGLHRVARAGQLWPGVAGIVAKEAELGREDAE